jgi:hypothetical protein
MAQSAEMQARIQHWRSKAREGTMTQEDFREALAALREDRAVSSATSAASKARKSAAKAKVAINSDDLLSELWKDLTEKEGGKNGI